MIIRVRVTGIITVTAGPGTARAWPGHCGPVTITAPGGISLTRTVRVTGPGTVTSGTLRYYISYMTSEIYDISKRISYDIDVYDISKVGSAYSAYWK
jgi:hypothetical protein